MRTCLGCRHVDERSRLLRFVLSDQLVVRDIHKSLPGRGAWLHPQKACVELALRRRAFNRAFRVSSLKVPTELL
ncbi:YlxR family protein [Actinomycetaceae bacterium TAE3-ERU4]|nr:YlxR family protein [Actinomycetaceae bacterium TAE3-ERU4]